MKNVRTLRLASLLAAALLVAAGVAWAEKTKLEARCAAGDTSKTVVRHTVDLSGTLSEEGQNVEMKLHQEQLEEYTDVVVAAEGGRVAKAKRTWAVYESTQQMTQAGMAEPARKETKPVVGKELTLVRDGGKVTIEGGAPPGADLDQEDLDLGDRYLVFLPGKEVETGESWTLTKEQLRAFIPSLQITEGTAKCTYQGVQDRGGAKAARIDLELDLTATSEEIPAMRMVMKGPYWWNVEKGCLAGIEIEGTTTFDMGEQGKMAGPSKVTLTREAK